MVVGESVYDLVKQATEGQFVVQKASQQLPGAVTASESVLEPHGTLALKPVLAFLESSVAAHTPRARDELKVAGGVAVALLRRVTDRTSTHPVHETIMKAAMRANMSGSDMKGTPPSPPPTNPLSSPPFPPLSRAKHSLVQCAAPF